MDLTIADKEGHSLITIGRHDLHGPRVENAAVHHDLEISCVLEGVGTYWIEGIEYDLQPGDVMLLPNTDRHVLLLNPRQDLVNLVIHFSPSFIWNSLAGDFDYNFLLIFFERGKNFSHRLDRSNPTTERIARLILEIWEEMNRQEVCYELLVKIKLQTILTELIRNYDYVDADRPQKPVTERDIAQLNAVIHYIDDHLAEEIRLPQLAAMAYVSPTYFSALFKRYYGIPPIEYVVMKRVQRAITLIRTTDRSLTDIAISCGFNNSTNFYKAFRRVTGRTPIAYRKKTSS